ELLLKESEEKYRLLFENMNVGFAYHEVIVDEENKPIDYKYLEVNPKFEELTGLKKENLIGKTVTEAIPGTENDPADWIGKFGNVGITGIPLTIEDYSEAINKWFNVSGYSPKKNHFAVTFTDITEIKKAESEVKASEKRYRQLFENSPVALMEIDLSGIKEYMDRLRISGIEDFNKFYEDYPHEIINTLTKSKIINVNWKTLDIYKAQSKEDFFSRMNDLTHGKIHFTEDVIFNNKMELLAFINGDTTYKSEMVSKTFTGDPLYLDGKTSILPGYEKSWSRVIVSIIDITDRKLTEQKLKDSEEKYRKLFENSPIGLMEQDFSGMRGYIDQLRKKGVDNFGKYFEEFPSEVQKFMAKVKVVDGNQKIMELYKIPTKEEFLFEMNHLAYNKLPDEVFLDNKREILAMINGDAVYESEIKSKNSLGETIYLYGKTSIVPGFEKSWSEVIVSIVDITERKNAEEALEKSREMFRDLLETSSIGVIEFDINNKTIQYVNPKLLEIIGYKKQELIDLESYNKIIHPKDLPKLLESNDEMELEFRITDKNGKLKWVTGKKIPHFDVNNNLISTRVWLEDVTEKKMYEELIYELNVNFLNFTADIQDNIHLLLNTALKLLNGDLIVYAHRVKSDNQDEYYLITSDGSAYTYDINQFSKKLLLNEFFKEDHDFPQIFTDIDEGKYCDSDPLIKKVQAKGSFGKVIRSQEGLENIVCVFYKNNPIINGQDKLVLFLICDAIEIEQRRWQVQQDLEEQNKTLNKINKLKTELFSRTSHELKTPLISIKGFTELLLTLHKSKLDTETLSILEEIKDGSKRLEKIINLLLESTKLEAGQLELKKTKEDLTFLINFCVKELKGLATLRDQTILFKPSNKIEVSFDKERIYEVISNLLLNAVKYTPPGGEISIKSSVVNNSIIVSVSDNGIGFTEEEKKQVFKQFGKIERYGQGWDVAIEGTGLGLYITKKLVELHGGKIWLESEGRNKGSTFYFSIPKS
ncbi:MAG: PAS domain S-box protein, partial [Promethearchaeota archaeon]